MGQEKLKNMSLKREIFWLIEEKYKGKIEKDSLRKDVSRLKKGEPIDYIIGWTLFLGCKIDLSKKPFIPREETEFWVEKAIEILKKRKKKRLLCLDLFSGSGCIGIALLKHLQNVKVDFGEIEEKFLEQIEKNIRLNKIDFSRVNLIKTDVFSSIKKKYDYIFANPPYIPEKRKTLVEKSVLLFEPKKALFGGKDGLKFIKKLIFEGKKYLKKEGEMFIEIDPSNKKKIEKILLKKGFSFSYIFDQFGKERVVWLKK